MKADILSMDPFFVVNPASAGGTTRARFLAMVPEIHAVFPRMAYVFTSAPLHAEQLALEAARHGVRMLVACGGHGTVNEVVNGAVASGRATDLALGVIPLGACGDLRHLVGDRAASDPVGYLRSGVSRHVDLGLLDFVDDRGHLRQRHFLNAAAFGIAGLVAREVARMPGWLGGRLGALLGAARGLLHWRNLPMKVLVDRVVFHEGPASLVAVSNGRCLGNARRIAPRADPADGLFDVVVMGDLPHARLAAMPHRLGAGTHLGQPGVSSTRGRVVEVQAEGVAPIDLDGEVPGRLPAKATLLPSALRLLVTPAAAGPVAGDPPG